MGPERSLVWIRSGRVGSGYCRLRWVTLVLIWLGFSCGFSHDFSVQCVAVLLLSNPLHCALSYHIRNKAHPTKTDHRSYHHLPPLGSMVTTKQVTQLLTQLTIEYGPRSAQLLDGALLPYIQRTYQLIPGAGLTTAVESDTANGATHQAIGKGPGPGIHGAGWPGISKGSTAGFSGTTGGGQLLPHEVAERSGIQKLYLSLIQHLSSNGLAGVLSSPTNGSHLDGILRSVLGGLSGCEDASTKKTCFYIFSLLLGGFNRGRSGGSITPVSAPSGTAAGGVANGSAAAVGASTQMAEVGGLKAARAAAAQRRSLSGKGGGLWAGSGPTVDMEPGVQAAVRSFVLEEVVPAALKCLIDPAPAGLDLRDAMAVSATLHMGALIKEAKVASGGSAGFVGAAVIACNSTPQVGVFGRQVRAGGGENRETEILLHTILVCSK